MLALASLVLSAHAALATPLLINGGFEQGTNVGWDGAGIAYFGLPGQEPIAYDGWQQYHTGSPGDPWYDLPAGILPAGGDAMATYYPDAPHLGILYQAFTVPDPGSTVSVSFDFYTDAPPATNWPCGFDLDCVDQLAPGYQPDELFRVDLVLGGVDPFSTAPGEHLPLLDGTDSYVFPALPYPYLHVEFDVSDFVAAGGTFLLRFAGYGSPYLHVDNASVELVPEPTTGLLIGLGVLGVLGAGRRR